MSEQETKYRKVYCGYCCNEFWISKKQYEDDDTFLCEFYCSDRCLCKMVELDKKREGE